MVHDEAEGLGGLEVDDSRKMVGRSTGNPSGLVPRKILPVKLALD